MKIKNIFAMRVKNILTTEELGKLAVNNNEEFSVIWMDNYIHYCRSGLFIREKDKESAMTLADVAMTKVARNNHYEEDGETILFGREYYVYNSEGERVYTGQIEKNIIN